MHRTIRNVLVTAATVALVGGAGNAALGSSTDARAGLSADLNKILSDPGLHGAAVSVLVRDASGQQLYAHDPANRLLPASNAKLFTSAAALDVLGPDYRFRTDVLADGTRHGADIRGDLYLRGGGDPTTLAGDYDELAQAVAKSGIRHVTGNLVADDTKFDDVRLGVGWAWDDEPYYYSGQVSALTVAPNTDYDAGTVIVESRPGNAVGKPARLKVVPATNYVHIVNRTRTTKSGDTSIDVERQHGNNTIVVTGTIAAGSDVDQEWATVWDPSRYAADVFKRALARHGVSVSGSTRESATPSAATDIAVHRSMTLQKMYVPFLKLSNNGHAEVLVKAMGAERAGDGSWSAGLGVMQEDLRKLGVDPDAMEMVDGSGLSRMDYIPARQITNVLLGAQQRPWFKAWYDALPISAQPDRFVGGTLRSRFVGTPAAGKIHAKTGSLTGVTTLSGYVIDADGERLIFSVMQNNLLNFDGETIEDAVGIRLAEFSRNGRSAGVQVAPAARRAPIGLECSWVKAC